MGEVDFIACDPERGAPVASVVGSPADVADFLAIWLQNTEAGVSPAQRLGIDVERRPVRHDTDGVAPGDDARV